MSDKKVGITTHTTSVSRHTQWRCCKEGFFLNITIRWEILLREKWLIRRSTILPTTAASCNPAERDDWEVTEVLITAVLWSLVVRSGPSSSSSLPHSQFIIFTRSGTLSLLTRLAWQPPPTKGPLGSFYLLPSQHSGNSPPGLLSAPSVLLTI